MLPAQTATENFHIRLLAWNEEQPQPLYVQTDAENFELLDLRSNRRSPRYDLNSAREVRIFTDGVDPEGNPIKVPVSKIPVPEGIREPLVILFARAGGEKPEYVGMVVEDGEESFPFGSYRLINFSPFPVVFELDGTAHSLSPRETALAKPDLNERVNIPVRVLTRIDGEPRLIRQTLWRHEPDQRMLVFILKSQDPQRGDLLLRTIVERESVYRRIQEKSTDSDK